MYPCVWFGVFKSSFPKLSQYLSTCETGITHPTEGLDTRVRSHLMWNKDLKIWSIGAQFPQITPIPEGLRNRYSSTHRGPWHQSKVAFDVKQGVKDFELLFMCPCTWFGVFGPRFPKLPQYPSTYETGIAQPTESSDTRIRSHLMWNKELKTLDYLFCPCTRFGVFGSSFPKLPQ